MIEDRFWEIVNKELEQQIMADERRELEELIKEHPELAAVREEFLALPQIIGETEQLDAPESMKANIMDQLNAVPARSVHEEVKVASGLRSLLANLRLSHAISFASGAIVCTVILLLALRPDVTKEPTKIGKYSGSFIIDDLPLGAKPLFEETMDSLATKGSIVALMIDDDLIVEFEATSELPSKLTIKFDPGQITLSEVKRDSEGDSLSIREGECSVSYNKTSHYQLVMTRKVVGPILMEMTMSNDSGRVDRDFTIPDSEKESGSNQ